MDPAPKRCNVSFGLKGGAGGAGSRETTWRGTRLGTCAFRLEMWDSRFRLWVAATTAVAMVTIIWLRQLFFVTMASEDFTKLDTGWFNGRSGDVAVVARAAGVALTRWRWDDHGCNLRCVVLMSRLASLPPAATFNS